MIRHALLGGALALALAGPAAAQFTTGSLGGRDALAPSAGVAVQMTVRGSDGEFVGTVDALEPLRIILTRDDPEAQGLHHALPRTAVAGVEDDTVVLTMTGSEAFRSWNAVSGPMGGAQR